MDIKKPPMGDPGNKIASLEDTINQFSLLIRAAIRKTSPSVDQLDMDDIEQEVKISIWKEIRKSGKEIRNLGSYIWRVAYTTTSKMMKRVSEQRKELIGPREEQLEKEERFKTGRTAQPDYQFQNRELLEIVRESVDSLIESRRQVIKLYLTGMSVEDITGFFGWTDGKARNLLSRGLADLRKVLRKKGIEFGE